MPDDPADPDLQTSLPPVVETTRAEQAKLWPPFFHADSDSVRFWVEVDGHPVGASVSARVLHYRFDPLGRDQDALLTYYAHPRELEMAVRRRVAQGSIEPVMLREFDLRAP